MCVMIYLTEVCEISFKYNLIIFVLVFVSFRSCCFRKTNVMHRICFQ
nr:MAG TPA: hypothetical protein [Caudoviricetes sp.]DAR76603.1 MAG TPA: hypothetical protein [Caudoviricetes sp.]